jgi:hypothetical protein
MNRSWWRKPESSNSKQFWTPAFAGVTRGVTFYDFIKLEMIQILEFLP